MFKPIREDHKNLLKTHGKAIQELELLFSGKVNVYIDFGNVRPWANKLNWHIDLKRLHRFLSSFDNVQHIKFYYGTLRGDQESIDRIEEAKKFGYLTRTKFVKIFKISIDASSVGSQSTDILKNFISPALLRRYDIQTIEYLNKQFSEMNKRGIYSIEDRKCNFDVEIGRDMTLDLERDGANTFVLWSGDSDFHDPLNEILSTGKKVILFASARLVSSELNDLRKNGLIVFDIKKIRDFICWKREIKP